VPLKNARWDLFLPPDFDYSGFEGTMGHETEAAPVVQVYSSHEYYQQEQEKATARKSEARSFLGNVRSRLASGNVKEANEDYQRLNAYADADTRKEIETLKKDLGKAQSTNLIQAQRAYTIENSTKYAQSLSSSGTAQQAVQAAEMVQYDAEAAERQWEVLQKAQEVSAAKIQPLRVNLPTRGQRHSFSQVLQTEIDKPMTIQFQAASSRDIGWMKKFIYAMGTFLMLWIFVAVVLNRRDVQHAASART